MTDTHDEDDFRLPTPEQVADEPGQWVEAFADLLSMAGDVAWHRDAFDTADFLNDAAKRLRNTL